MQMTIDHTTGVSYLYLKDLTTVEGPITSKPISWDGLVVIETDKDGSLIGIEITGIVDVADITNG